MSNQFAENLKHIMAAREMTNDELSKRSGICAQSIASYRTAKMNRPGTKNLHRLATALNCSPTDLLGPQIPTNIYKQDYRITPELMKKVSDYQHGKIPYVTTANLSPCEPPKEPEIDKCTVKLFAPATEAVISADEKAWGKNYIISLFLSTVKENLDCEDIFNLFGKAVFQAAMNE